MLSARTGPHACAPQDNFSGRRFRERTLNSGEPVQLNLHLCSPPGSAARSVGDYYRAGCDRSGAGAARDGKTGPEGFVTMSTGSKSPNIIDLFFSLQLARTTRYSPSAFRSFSGWVGLIRVNVFVGGWLRPEAFKN